MHAQLAPAVNEAKRRACAMARDYRVFLVHSSVLIRPTCDTWEGNPLCIVRQTGTIQWQSQAAADHYNKGETQ